MNLSRLATYNAECARGIVHTEEWDELMRQEQLQFNAEHEQLMAGYEEIRPGVWEKDPVKETR